jgi:hypothetical protein
MTRSLPRATRSSLASALALATACASGPLVQSPPPAAAEGDPDPQYPGRCSFMRLEAVERPSPAPGVGPDNLGDGSVELVATYRPGDKSATKPLAYSFLVAQERVNDLRAHLEQNPVIVCRGEAAGGDSSPSTRPGPSFEGQYGQPVTGDAGASPPPPGTPVPP